MFTQDALWGINGTFDSMYLNESYSYQHHNWGPLTTSHDLELRWVFWNKFTRHWEFRQVLIFLTFVHSVIGDFSEGRASLKQPQTAGQKHICMCYVTITGLRMKIITALCIKVWVSLCTTAVRQWIIHCEVLSSWYFIIRSSDRCRTSD